MENKLKSGKEIMDEFFADLETIEGVDESVANSLKALYIDNKLSEKNIINALNDLRTTS
ncbi:hypothetical protein ABDJ41_19135 [Pedobacter sp. ASV1-7]|uniref:hypothetical protein n=1 Tax=Pedobacter sp. ASV1-7 TaxID=3145237 RepID=UPI0032E911C7